MLGGGRSLTIGFMAGIFKTLKLKTLQCGYLISKVIKLQRHIQLSGT